MPAVGSFISTLSNYAFANVQRANENGNGFLTKAESLSLPLDLQDNYQAHQASHHNAGVEKFQQAFTAYAAIQVRNADANKDGWLSAKESKNLPTDLKDNYVNYMTLR